MYIDIESKTLPVHVLIMIRQIFQNCDPYICRCGVMVFFFLYTLIFLERCVRANTAATLGVGGAIPARQVFNISWWGASSDDLQRVVVADMHI